MFENLSATTIYLTTFFSIFLNGITNLPSSQIIYLSLGKVATENNNFNIYIAILLGSVANTFGNFILYKIIYTHSDFLNTKLGKILSVDSVILEKYNNYFKHKWWGWLIVGKLTPSVKVLVPIICGVSKVSASRSLIIFFFGSLVWAALVTYLGFYFGKQASLFEFYLVVTCIYILIGLFSYWKIKNKK